MDLHRSYIFRNSKETYEGVPVISANMDTTGTFEMAKALAKVNSFDDQILDIQVLSRMNVLLKFFLRIEWISLLHDWTA